MEFPRSLIPVGFIIVLAILGAWQIVRSDYAGRPSWVRWIKAISVWLLAILIGLILLGYLAAN